MGITPPLIGLGLGSEHFKKRPSPLGGVYCRREGFSLIRCHRLIGGLAHVMADGMLPYCGGANADIIPYIHSNIKRRRRKFEGSLSLAV